MCELRHTSALSQKMQGGQKIPWGRKSPSHCWLGQVSRAGLMSRYSALPLCVTGRAEPFFCRLRSSLVQSVFFGQRPQPPLGTCSSAPKICSLKSPQARIHGGRRQEAKRLLAKAENEGTAPFPLPKLAQRRARQPSLFASSEN